MYLSNQPKQPKEEWIKLEKDNKLNIQIVNNMLKIHIIFNSKEYLSFFSLDYLKQEYEKFSNLFLINIKRFIDQIISKKNFSIINDLNTLKLTLLYNNNQTIELYIPFNDKKKEVSLENTIRLETELINIKSKLNNINTNIKPIKDLFENKNKNYKVLYYQIYHTNSSIEVSGKQLTEIPFFTQEFTTEESYQIVHVNINLFFSYMDEDDAKGKILTYLDDDLISELNVIKDNCWPIIINGYKQNVQKGKHLIKILANVDKGNLYLLKIIPFFKYVKYREDRIGGNISIVGY